MRHLNVDIETFSTQDIGSTGLYRYAEDPSFAILLIGYAFDFGEVRVIDLAQGEPVPENLIQALQDPDVIKHAYNAAFEITCLNCAGYTTPPDQWRDTMLHGLYLGYPAGLDKLGKALGLPEDKRKLATGKALIRFFCKPCTPTRRNYQRTRNYPTHDIERWELFKEYNRQDVITEMEDYKRLSRIPVPDDVQRDWVIDYELNSRGILLDKDLYIGAITIDDENQRRLMQRAKDLTGLANPKSREQMLGWLNANSDLGLTELTKESVAEAIPKAKGAVAEVLDIRRRLSKTSVSKYKAMENAVCSDGRIRGMLQYYGAGRTGRWAGRFVQVQNLPHDTPLAADIARKIVKQGELKKLNLLYNRTSDILSELIRTAFIAPKDSMLCVADFAAIEARVLSWLAGEEWEIEAFKEGKDVYCATASAMFGVPVVRHGINGELRQKGKIATLALGYQGGPAALIAMGALQQGLTEKELPDIVQKWRAASPHIVEYWYEIDKAAVKAVKNGIPTMLPHGIVISATYDLVYGYHYLVIQLPSGRKLYYPQAIIKENQFDRPAIHYKTQIGNAWATQSTYGGKLVENITQAVARDCLATALRRLVDAGYKPLMHIHDEVVLEVPKAQMHEDEQDRIIKIMCAPIPWAPGLLLNADGFISTYYKKD